MAILTKPAFPGILRHECPRCKRGGTRRGSGLCFDFLVLPLSSGEILMRTEPTARSARHSHLGKPRARAGLWLRAAAFRFAPHGFRSIGPQSMTWLITARRQYFGAGSALPAPSRALLGLLRLNRAALGHICQSKSSRVSSYLQHVFTMVVRRSDQSLEAVAVCILVNAAIKFTFALGGRTVSGPLPYCIARTRCNALLRWSCNVGETAPSPTRLCCPPHADERERYYGEGYLFAGCSGFRESFGRR